MRISFVVAADRNGVIGGPEGIPWRLPDDLKRFKHLTMGKPIVMGRTTREHIGRPLPGRTNIVLSAREDYRPEESLVARNLSDALVLARETGTDEVMIVGGGKVYREALPLADRIHLTRVEGEFTGDVSVDFGLDDPTVWRLSHEERFPADDRNPHPTTYLVYDRVGRG